MNSQTEAQTEYEYDYTTVHAYRDSVDAARRVKEAESLTWSEFLEQGADAIELVESIREDTGR